MEFRSKEPAAKAPAETFTGDARVDVVHRGEGAPRTPEARADGPAKTEWGALVSDEEYHR